MTFEEQIYRWLVRHGIEHVDAANTLDFYKEQPETWKLSNLKVLDKAKEIAEARKKSFPFKIKETPVVKKFDPFLCGYAFGGGFFGATLFELIKWLMT